MQREGLRAFDGSELYFETKHYCTGKVYNGLLGPGRLRGGRRPVGSRFRQPDRTPFFRLTPAFLRSLRAVSGLGPEPDPCQVLTYNGHDKQLTRNFDKKSLANRQFLHSHESHFFLARVLEKL